MPRSQGRRYGTAGLLHPHAGADPAQASIQRQSDGELFWKITSGRGEKPRSSLAERQVWSVILYLRTLPSRRLKKFAPQPHGQRTLRGGTMLHWL